MKTRASFNKIFLFIFFLFFLFSPNNFSLAENNFDLDDFKNKFEILKNKTDNIKISEKLKNYFFEAKKHTQVYVQDKKNQFKNEIKQETNNQTDKAGENFKNWLKNKWAQGIHKTKTLLADLKEKFIELISRKQ